MVAVLLTAYAISIASAVSWIAWIITGFVRALS